MHKRKIALLIPLIALVFMACNKEGASSPTEAYKSFYAAAQKKDGAAMKKLVASSFLERAERKAKEKNQSVEDYLAASGGDFSNFEPEPRNEHLSGDTATLDVKVKEANGGQWISLNFVKEGGWKIIPDEMRPAKTTP
jgi:ABC-type enterochelin transport system substrate-binding protein